MIDLQYPIGKLERKSQLTEDERKAMIRQIADTPANLRKAVAGLTDQQADTPYRPGGWTVRQVAHHLPDSHMNAYIRVKLALTESQPPAKPYNEKLWAELFDVKEAPIDSSVRLLEALHERWVLLLRSLSPADCARTLVHPEIGVMTIDSIVNLYSWHGRHHVAHITSLRDRMGWK